MYTYRHKRKLNKKKLSDGKQKRWSSTKLEGILSDFRTMIFIQF